MLCLSTKVTKYVYVGLQILQIKTLYLICWILTKNFLGWLHEVHVKAAEGNFGVNIGNFCVLFGTNVIIPIDLCVFPSCLRIAPIVFAQSVMLSVLSDWPVYAVLLIDRWRRYELISSLRFALNSHMLTTERLQATLSVGSSWAETDQFTPLQLSLPRKRERQQMK